MTPSLLVRDRAPRRAMHARAAVATRLADGRTVLPLLRSAPPLTLRQTGPHAVHLVSTAAGPLGGDRYELDLDLAPGTTLELGSIASTLVLPGAGESLTVVTARVGDGATLRFTPEPTVLAAGCAHRLVVRLALEGSAQVLWREEIVFGRYGEAPGRCHSRFDATLDGKALLRQEFVVGDPTIDTSPAVYGNAHCVGNTLIVSTPPTNPQKALPPATPHEAPPHTSAQDGPHSAAPHEAPPYASAQEGARAAPLKAPPYASTRSATPLEAPPHASTRSATPLEAPPHASTRSATPLGTHPAPQSIVGDGVAVLPLATRGTLVSALARDAVELRSRLLWGESHAEPLA